MPSAKKKKVSKPTPGPWETGSTKTRVEVLPEGWNMPMCIADCHTKNAPEAETERVANARLIAAAPDMLDALKKIAADPGMYSAMIIAKDAIAKATGCDRKSLR